MRPLYYRSPGLVSVARIVPDSRAAKHLSSAKSWPAQLLAMPEPSKLQNSPREGSIRGNSCRQKHRGGGWSTVLKQWFLLFGVRERLVKTMDSQKNAPNAADASRGFTGSGKVQPRTVIHIPGLKEWSGSRSLQVDGAKDRVLGSTGAWVSHFPL